MSNVVAPSSTGWWAVHVSKCLCLCTNGEMKQCMVRAIDHGYMNTKRIDFTSKNSIDDVRLIYDSQAILRRRWRALTSEFVSWVDAWLRWKCLRLADLHPPVVAADSFFYNRTILWLYILLLYLINYWKCTRIVTPFNWWIRGDSFIRMNVFLGWACLVGRSANMRSVDSFRYLYFVSVPSEREPLFGRLKNHWTKMIDFECYWHKCKVEQHSNLGIWTEKIEQPKQISK